jgi:hypothetical protein
MASFIHFLRLECSAIHAFIESAISSEEEEENVEVKLNAERHISNNQRLQEYFEVDDLHISSVVNDMIPWPLALRVAIIDHLLILDINVSLLIDVIESYRFNSTIAELVEIVRALDILGAEKRLAEYEALLYLRLKIEGTNDNEWEKRCGNGLPVSFFENVTKYRAFKEHLFSKILGYVGSQKLIEYFLLHLNLVNVNVIFIQLCSQNHLFVAQWLLELGLCDIDIHEESFQIACSKGHLTIAQWLYSLGSVNIHMYDEKIFQSTCKLGHLSVAQWLHSLGGVNFHRVDDYAFREACKNGHLAVAQWLHSLGGVNIHAQQDGAFRFTCTEGHLSVAQWLHSLGNVNIHVQDDWAFRYTCTNGHIAVAEWLYSLGGINIHSSNEWSFRSACVNDHVQIAQWLHSLGGVDIHAEDDEAFRRTCERGQLLTAQWLYSLGGVNIHAVYDWAFREACCAGHFSVVQWLYSLGGIQEKNWQDIRH